MPGRVGNRIARRLGGPAARRRRHRRVALALVLLVGIAVVLVVAGSGDGDGDADDPVAGGGDGQAEGPAPSGDPVVDACRRSNEELATARRALLEDNDAPGAAEGFLADAFVDLMRDRSAAIRGVDPPPAPEVLELLDELDRVVDAVEADPSIGLGANPFADVDERWRALGLDDCAVGGSTVGNE